MTTWFLLISYFTKNCIAPSIQKWIFFLIMIAPPVLLGIYVLNILYDKLKACLTYTQGRRLHMLHTLELSTTGRDEMRDITREITSLVHKSGIQEGTVLIYCPHTTAGIVINENADPDVKHDVLMRLDEVYPWEHPKYRHAEGNTASHLKSMTCGASQTVIITEGELLLGRWQGIYFCEFDGPRRRQYHVKIMQG